ECIAEWVEDIPTLKLLRSIGIDYGQGHILARPVSLPEILVAAGSQDLHLGQNVRTCLQAPLEPDPGFKTILSAVKAHSRLPEASL
ncbi:MAG: hypothetical protein WA888_24135, partial [Burkholderiaceae bacterium]